MTKLSKKLLLVALALVLVVSVALTAACKTNYELTYAAGDGTGEAPAAEKYPEGAEITLKAADTFTAPQDKEFDGWLVDGVKKAAGDKITMPAKDLTITAQWKAKSEPQPEKWTVTFKNGDDTVKTVQVVKGQKLAASDIPTDPTAPKGQSFEGWFNGATKIDENATIDGNITAVAKFEDLAPAIADEVNAIILHESELANGNKLKGEMDLFDDGTGYIYLENATSELPIIEYAGITYSIDSQGVFKILTDDSGKITVPATGSVKGNLVRITIENASATGTKIQYAFESEVYKLTIKYGYEKYEGVSSIEQYIPVGMTNDFTQEQRQGYTLTAIKVNGAQVSLNDVKNVAMPASDVTISYEWEAVQEVNYTVTYKAGEGVGEDYQVTATSASYKLLNTEAAKQKFSREGWSLVGWTVNGEEKDFGATITLTGNTEVIARYRQMFTVTLAGLDASGVVRGGSGDWEALLSAGYSEVSKFTLPNNHGGIGIGYYVTRSGFTLTGWTSSADGQTYNPGESVAITQNTTFTAVWQANPPVTGSDFDGKWVSEEGLAIESAVIEIFEFTIDGKNFTSEDLNGELTIDGNTATMTVGFYEYTLTLNQGVLTISAKRLASSTTYTGEFTKFVATNKTLADYEGCYWLGEISFNGDDYDLAWIEEGKLYLQEASYAPSNYALTEDKTGAQLVATYQFDNGFLGTTTITVTFISDTQFTISYEKTGMGAATAQGTFTKATVYTVTYALGDDYHGEEQAPAAAQVVGGRKATAPTLAKVTGWKFLGWYAAGADQAFDFTQAITADITLTAHWEQITQVTITFAIQAGVNDVNAPAAQTIAFNTAATEPAESMAREGYRFDGWFDGSSKFDFATLVTEDITLTAKWSRIYTVTYVLPSDATGSAPQAATVCAGDSYTLVTCAATSTKGTFVGWKIGNGNDAYAAGSTRIINNDITLTAVFGVEYSLKNDTEDDSLRIILRSDNIVKYVGYFWNYSIDGAYAALRDIEDDYVAIILWIDFDAHEYLPTDGMQQISFTGSKTDDTEVTLTFDGIGGAKLGTINGTYTLVWGGDDYDGYYIAGFNLTVGEETYENILFDVDEDDQLIINVKITVDEMDYTFGNPPEEYTITFELGEGEQGTAPAPIKVWSNVGEITLPSGDGITKEGYKFVGWKVKDSDSDDHWTGKIPVSSSGTLVPAWEEDNGGSGDDMALSAFGGEGSANAGKYGYASSSAAKDANNALTIINSSAQEKTFYYATFYFNISKGQYYIYIYYTSIASASGAVNDKDGNAVTSVEAENQVLTLVNTTFGDFTISFAMQDGKRTVTITNGDNSVTWTEITA